MTLPPQEKLFTEEEVGHLVAREVAKQRMHDIERSIQTMKDDSLKMWAKFDAGFDSLQKAIENRDADLRKEMERDFATKLDLEQLKGEVSRIWLKVSVPVATIVSLITVGSHYIK